MATPSTILQTRPAGSPFKLGQKVKNLGFIWVVAGWHYITNDPMLIDPAHPRRGYVHANPAMCEPVDQD